MVKKIILVFIAISTISLLQAYENIIAPVGWRFPTIKDFPEQERMSLATTKILRGYNGDGIDFNGDGISDKIITLICKKNKNIFGLFVYYGEKSDPQKINKNPIPTIEYHLYPVKAGTYYLPRYTKTGTPITNHTQTLELKYGGFIRQEIEYGFGTIYWLTKKGWKHAFSTRDPLNKIHRNN